jgi:predicted nucleic acid-binding protein
MQFIAAVARPTSIAYSWRPNLRNEADNMILELAAASGSDYLITRNTGDFLVDADLNNEDVRIVTPRQFLHTWRDRYGR